MAVLTRTTFDTSRLLEFCNEKELVAQTGHGTDDWPLVILKELLDNSLDACEEADVEPVVRVTVDERGISVADNGPGIPTKTIEGVLDYSIRVSSREAYVAPDRGAQGNALKTLIAMPFILSGDDERGQVDVTVAGDRHEILFSVDPIRQKPRIERTVVPGQKVRNGTVFTVRWPEIASEIVAEKKDEFLLLASDFTFLNPHLSLFLNWFGEKDMIAATNAAWRKCRPRDPTSAHWYGPEELERLLAAYIGHDQDREADRYVRDVVREFRGLSGSAKLKSVLSATGMVRMKLSSLANGDGMDHSLVAELLWAMKLYSKEVKPSALGVIGKDHVRNRFIDAGCDEKTFHYKKITYVDEGVPVVVETAFALLKDEEKNRRIVTGVNWSGAVGNPFRDLGQSYEDGLHALLEKQMAGRWQPVIVLVHCACPSVHYTDRGKTNIEIS